MSRSLVTVRTRALWVLAVLVLAAVALLAVPATAANTRVAVQDKGEDGGQYDPAAVSVFEGDQVMWVWEGDNHSVTFHDPSIRSSECTVFVVIQCSNTGDSHRVTFNNAGKYDYYCRVHGAAMSGSVTVEPDPEPTEPSETESTDPEPTPTVPLPTDPEPSDPEPSDPEPSDPEPTDPEPSDEDPTDPEPSDPEPTDPDPTEPEPTETATPTDPANEPSEAPTATGTPVEVPEPTFEPFPAPGDTASPDEVAGGVSITPPDDGSGSRTLWGVVGGLTVLGTIGAIGRSVLFAEPWDTL